MHGTSRHPFVQPIGILLVCSNTSGRAVPFRWPPYPIRYTRTRKRRTEDPTCVEMMSKRDRGLIENDDDDASSSSENESESYFDVPNIHAPSSNHRDDDAASQAPSTSSSRRTVGGIRSSLTTTLLRAPSDPSSPAAGNSPLPPPPLDRNPSSGTPFSPAEYKYFLGLDLVELAKVLTPQEDLCQQQFELVIDDLCFLGHPLRPVGQGLTWKFVDEDTEKPALEMTRGRTNAPRVALSTGSTLGVQGITPATNAASELAIEEPATPMPPKPRLSLSTSSSDPTPINFFHLVIVIDQPDTTVKDKALRPTRKLDALYRQLIFKVTAALLKAQVEENWVAIQNHELVGMRETFLKNQIPWEDFLRHAVETNPLANALHTIYESLFKPPFSTTIKIASLPLYLQLPVLPAQTDLDWSWFDEVVFPDDEGDDSPLLAAGEIQMVPWKALLLLKDPAQMEWEYKSRTTSETWTASQRSHQPSGTWFGSGLGGTLTDIEPERGGTSTGSQVGGNGEVEEFREEAEEISIASKLFMRALEPGMNLADVAAVLNLALKKDVFPLARLLVSRRKAKLIDPIKSATRNYYLPSTSDGKDMARLQVDFHHHFPQLPHLLTFFSRITLAGPVPYATLIPDVMNPDQRRLYFDALIWLLREDLLVEAPLRVRMFARREVKLKAKRIEVASMQERVLEKKMQREAAASVVEHGGSVVGGGSKTPTFEGVFVQDYSEDDEALEDEDEEDEGVEDVDWMGEESLINNPAQCKGIELAWIDAMCLDKSEADTALFMRLFKYFDGKTTIHEMQYREQLSRKEVTRVLKKFEQELIVTIHP